MHLAVRVYQVLFPLLYTKLLVADGGIVFSQPLLY